VPSGFVAPYPTTLATPVTISFGSTAATIGFQGLAPGNIGLYQFNFTVPALANGDYQIKFVQGALTLPQTDISLSVGLSFALAASTFCPVLVIGIWWRKLTWVGAAAGMTIGGGLVLVALVLNIISKYTGAWAPWPVIQPALITVPVAFAAVFLGSLATQSRVPDDVSRILLRLHAPDPLGFIRDRDVARFGATSAPDRPVDGRHHR